MVCAWLLFRYTDATPAEAIDLFATMRTNQVRSDQYQGIETYSQRRYVEYFCRFIRSPELLRTPPFKLIAINAITVGPLHSAKATKTKRASNSAVDLLSDHDDLEHVEWIARVVQRDEAATESPDKAHLFGKGTVNENVVHFQPEDKVNAFCGNICVKIIKRKEGESHVFASFWIHTYFLDIDHDAKGRRMVIPKLECDKLHKDKTHKVAPPEMTVTLDFDALLRNEGS